MFELETKMLLIDDSPIAREVLKRTLTDMGYRNLEEANGGKEGLEKIKVSMKSETPYGAVFVDWVMPDLEGIEVLRQCRGTLGFKELPLIMVTAESERSSVIQAAHEGISAYVTKPVTPKDLELVFKSLFKRLGKK